MMNRNFFEKSIIIKCGQKEIFEFHRDTNNLPVISPPFPKAEIISMSERPLIQNSTISLKLNFGLFKQNWEIKIDQFNEPEMISDLQTKGIFEYWHHYHIFEKVDAGTKMTDRIEFTPPFGLLGKLFLPFISLQLKTMFNYRHKKTKDFFENK